jgi:FtsP/CotA-like multicopper oxidase with cupredoxin domain
VHTARSFLSVPIAALLSSCELPPAVAAAAGDATQDSTLVVPNDNRRSGGALRDGTYRVQLVARHARWRADAAVDSLVSVQVFVEEGQLPQIPGPLLRAPQGTQVQVSVRNTFSDTTLVVHGLRAGTVANDTVHVAPRTTRTVAYTATRPGTYHYWGTTTKASITERSWRDSQLSGALIIDPSGVVPDTSERIFVMTVLDVFRGDTVRNKRNEDIWELSINGKSWPHTERLQYNVGDSVKWRFINASYLPHPMHMHGFHFRVVAKGTGFSDTLYAKDDERLAVTEFMRSGSTFSMRWLPTREGSWLMHCHMIPHITPFPERTATARGKDMEHVAQHAEHAMAGLVLGIQTMDSRGSAIANVKPVHTLRLLAQQARGDSGKVSRHGFVLHRNAIPAVDSVDVPGPPLLLERGRTTAITVVNRLREPTTVHWHGMELESVYDGVAGWSRTGPRIAPLVAPGDSFTAVMTPPRAGTYIYHTHMDEGAQLGSGMYGPMIVLEPGTTYDPESDLTFIIGGVVDGDTLQPGLNGSVKPRERTLEVGTTYRFRFINILFAPAARIELRSDTTLLEWKSLAKDV